MSNNGFMLLHRNLLNWEWFDDSQMVHIWIYFLLKANYEDGKWHGVDVPRGSFITSVRDICKDTGLSVQNVRTCIKKLKSTSNLTIKVTNKFSIITICNYDSYNNAEFSTNNQSNKQTNNVLTNKQQTEQKRKSLLKEKNIKEEKERKEKLSKESKEKEGNNFSSEDLTTLFDAFRVKYKQYGGRVRGLDTELANLKKKHSDWKEIIPALSDALENENLARRSANAKGDFFPVMKNLQTYINNRSWETYSDNAVSPCGSNGYFPLADGNYQRWNPVRNCLEVNSPYFNMWDDGYNKENRPDGATVAYQQYTWKWSKDKKDWISQR